MSSEDGSADKARVAEIVKFAAQLDAVKHKFEGIRLMFDEVVDPDTVTLVRVCIFVQRLNECVDKVDEVYDAMQLFCTWGEFGVHQKDFLELQKRMDGFLAELLVLKEDKTPDPTASTVTHRTQAPGFKLPKIDLPKFSGAILDWQSFRDQFVPAVHAHAFLSGTEKLIHLKSCLTGEAEALISSFKPTDANYPEAWATLNQRYSPKREIIFAHLNKFLDMKPVQVGSEKCLIRSTTASDP